MNTAGLRTLLFRDEAVLTSIAGCNCFDCCTGAARSKGSVLKKGATNLLSFPSKLSNTVCMEHSKDAPEGCLWWAFLGASRLAAMVCVVQTRLGLSRADLQKGCAHGGLPNPCHV